MQKCKKFVITLFILLTIFSCLLCGACNSVEKINDKDLTQNEDNSSQDSTDETGGILTNNTPFDPIYVHYANTDTASFANLKIFSVGETVYYDFRDPDHSIRYIILECVLEEDFYGKISKGTVVNVPILLNLRNDTYFNESDLSELFKKDNYILTYIRYLYDKELYSLSTEEKFLFSNATQVCPPDSLDLIPINDEKVDLKSLYSWCESRDVNIHSYNLMRDFTKYINGGMTIDEVTRNLKDLANDSNKFLKEFYGKN